MKTGGGMDGHLVRCIGHSVVRTARERSLQESLQQARERTRTRTTCGWSSYRKRKLLDPLLVEGSGHSMRQQSCRVCFRDWAPAQVDGERDTRSVPSLRCTSVSLEKERLHMAEAGLQALIMEAVQGGGGHVLRRRDARSVSAARAPSPFRSGKRGDEFKRDGALLITSVSFETGLSRLGMSAVRAAARAKATCHARHERGGTELRHVARARSLGT
eukprot:5038890-Pleurochrysis_carterae.AAC.3